MEKKYTAITEAKDRRENWGEYNRAEYATLEDAVKDFESFDFTHFTYNVKETEECAVTILETIIDDDENEETESVMSCYWNCDEFEDLLDRRHNIELQLEYHEDEEGDSWTDEEKQRAETEARLEKVEAEINEFIKLDWN